MKPDGSAEIWNSQHDKVLIKEVLRHGYVVLIKEVLRHGYVVLIKVVLRHGYVIVPSSTVLSELIYWIGL